MFVPYYKVTQCSVVREDRRATFPPLGVRHACGKGKGKWRTVVVGSIFAGGQRHTGRVQSDKDVKLPCN